MTLYVGPRAPEGVEATWIPTNGKRSMPTMRLYGPTAEFMTKTFKLPDFELADQECANSRIKGRQTTRCSEPGVSVAAAIVASCGLGC